MDVKVTRRNLGRYAQSLPKRVSDAVYEAGDELETLVKVAAPVDTGALQKSYTAQPENDYSVVVGSPLDYSVYQEYGTSKMPAQPHLTPATDAASPAYQSRLLKALNFDE